MPAAKLVTSWVPLAALLFKPLPETATEVALLEDQEIVAVPGAVVALGDADMDAVTAETAFTVKLAERVTGPPVPCAVIVKL